MPLAEEFDRQVQNLLHKGYPQLAGLKPEEFAQRLGPLRERLGALVVEGGASEGGHVPFVIVVRRGLIAPERAMALTECKGKPGFTGMAAEDIGRFAPIAGLAIPHGWAYLLADVDTGKNTLNLTPDEAFAAIRQAGRSPLTLDEGIALVTHYPEALKRGNSFSMLGSRCGDRRVTALWLSAGRPRLGWCWAGNPHTWLGSASCRDRFGMV